MLVCKKKKQGLLGSATMVLIHIVSLHHHCLYIFAKITRRGYFMSKKNYKHEIHEYQFYKFIKFIIQFYCQFYKLTVTFHLMSFT